MEGIIDTKPVINTIKFTKKGKMDVYLDDGRIIIVPLSLFPSIKKLNFTERKKWQILDDSGFTFENGDEVYHIEQVLGRYDDYKFNL